MDGIVRDVDDIGCSVALLRAHRLQHRNRRVGDKVEAQFKGKGKFYPGKISKVNGDGTINVDFDDGDKDRYVEPSSFKLLGGGGGGSGGGRGGSDTEGGGELEVGTKIEARYKGKTRYYPGKISRVRSNGTYDIDYDDGEKEISVFKEMIRVVAVAGGPPEFKVLGL